MGQYLIYSLLFLFFPIINCAGTSEKPEKKQEENAFQGASTEYLITDYGAIGDGTTLNTSAIQYAIDKCSMNGGGKVIVPAGDFLTGTLVLRNNIEIHLTAGALILGSTHIEDYPEMTTDYGFYGDDWVKQSLLFGANLNNISLTGTGTIDGQGGAFPVSTKVKPDRYRNRPYLIRFIECKNIRVKNLTLQNSAMWMQHYLACEDLLISGIRVYNHCNQNNDMMDIDGCKNVIISGCTGDTDDDGITFKSTSPKACENIIVSDCIISSHCNAIKFGTESTGGFKNVSITNCVIKPSEVREVIYGKPDGISGISLEIVDGGTMDGINISDIVMEGSEVPIFLRLGNRARPYKKDAPLSGAGTLKNISIQNIIARNCGNTGCSITGIPGHPVTNISLKNINLNFKGGIPEMDPNTPVPEMEDSYPEATMFGILSSSIFFIRHAESVTISGLSATFNLPDGRVHLISEDVNHLKYDNVLVEDSPGTFYEKTIE